MILENNEKANLNINIPYSYNDSYTLTYTHYRKANSQVPELMRYKTMATIPIDGANKGPDLTKVASIAGSMQRPSSPGNKSQSEGESMQSLP